MQKLSLSRIIADLLLCFAWVGTCQSSKVNAEVRIFNELDHEVQVLLKNGTTQVNFTYIQPQSSSMFRKVQANINWKILAVSSIKDFDLGVQMFISDHRYQIVVHNITGKPGVISLDVRNQEPSRKSRETSLTIEESLLTIKSVSDKKIVAYGVSSNCYQCDLQPLTLSPDGSPMAIPSKSNESVKIDTRWNFKLLIKEDSGKFCRLNYHFGEYGHYSLSVKSSNSSSLLSCTVMVDKIPHNKYMPIIIMFASLGGIIVVYFLFNICIRKRCKKGEEEVVIDDKSLRLTPVGQTYWVQSGNVSQSTANLTETDSQDVPKKSRRLRSLDTFRGISIVLMIFVNYEGGKYWFFEHALWNGLHVADLVFPWFIFMMGTSIELSQKGLRKKNTSKVLCLWKITKRSIIMFSLGLILFNFADPTKWRIPGVLQRFGVSYFLVATMNLFLRPSDEKLENAKRHTFLDHFLDLMMFWSQWVLMICVLSGFLLITFLLPVPGCPRGYLGPGGIGDNGKFPKCTGGAAGYIDRVVLGRGHIYGNPTCKAMYKTTMPFDPEGILGCLPSIFLTFLGLQVAVAREEIVGDYSVPGIITQYQGLSLSTRNYPEPIVERAGY